MPIYKDTSSGSSPVFFNAVITPPTITVAYINDYNPEGLLSCNVIRISASTNGCDIGGIVQQEPNREIRIYNVGIKAIVLRSAYAGSVAENRFELNTNATLAKNEGCIIIYDGFINRWRIISKF